VNGAGFVRHAYGFPLATCSPAPPTSLADAPSGNRALLTLTVMLGIQTAIIAFAISAWWLRERHRPAEYAASGLVLLGVVGVVVLG